MLNSTKISLFVLLFAATALHAGQATKSRLPLSTYAKGERICVGNDGCVAIADSAGVHFVVDSYTVEQLPDGFMKKTVVASRPCMSIWGYPLFTKTITIQEIESCAGQSIKAGPPHAPGGPVGVVRPTPQGNALMIVAFAIGLFKIVGSMSDRIKHLEEENEKLLKELETAE